MRISILGVFILCAFAAGCGGDPDRLPFHRQEEWHAPVQSLLHYAGPDGTVTRAGLEEGLRKDFAAADANHSGVLEPDEMRAVNQQRWNEDRSAVSPLQDWNGDGVIDFSEFAAGPRALFNELDRDRNGILSADELRAAAGLGPDSGPKDESSPPRGGGDEPRGGRGGRRGPPGG